MQGSLFSSCPAACVAQILPAQGDSCKMKPPKTFQGSTPVGFLQHLLTHLSHHQPISFPGLPALSCHCNQAWLLICFSDLFWLRGKDGKDFCWHLDLWEIKPNMEKISHISKSAVIRWRLKFLPRLQHLLGAGDQRPDPPYQTHKLPAIKLQWVFH